MSFTKDEIAAMAVEAGLVRQGFADKLRLTGRTPMERFAALVAAKEREAVLLELRSGGTHLPTQVAARWPSVPGSHKYAGAGGCAPGSFGPDSEDLFTTDQLLDYGDRRAAAAIRARCQKEGA